VKTRYLKIRLKKGNLGGLKASRTIYFRMVRESPTALFGFQVDKETGEEIGCTATKDLYHLIFKACIENTSEMYEDLKYGGLTSVDTETQLRKMQPEK
jgi:hypothetical protein